LSIVPNGDFSGSYGASPAIWNHILLAATRHGITQCYLPPITGDHAQP